MYSMITQTALTTLEKGVNKLIMMDAEATEQMATLEGKTIAIYSTTPRYCFVIIPTSAGIFLTQTNESPIDAELTASSAVLLQLLLAKNKEHFLRSTDLIMAGNTGLLYQFFKILDNLNPDWEHELSQWFSPDLLTVATQAIQSGNQQIKQSIAFVQSQLSQLFDNTTVQPNNKAHQTPLTALMDSLQKRFKKS
ncbi:hypothetical protein DKL61_11980 [Gammaproteobacteria bacterium ESL0073]|nr:hypothetical protein DKL61_11980 [Gammaproteobacteria bacterium ESL0073]